MDDHTILKVLVGSRAHGLAGPTSDDDYRRVFVIPTVELFKLGFKPSGTRWAKDNGDETAWEIAPFLSLALQCHPLALETLVAPIVTANEWGQRLRDLFPAIWAPQRAYDSFLGYAGNQRTKFLEKKDGRPAKYAATYLRTLYHLCELLETGTFTLRVMETPITKTLMELKEGRFRMGQIIDLGEYWTEQAQQRLRSCTHRADPEVVDAFLIRVRYAFLEPSSR